MCRIEAEISFITVDDETGLETTYDLIRTASETLRDDGGFDVVRGEEPVIFRKDRTGDEPIPNPRAFLNNRVLPLALKDVFFIDGDRALAFIETTDERSAKRARVERAVRQLLGLDLLESAQRHVDQARRDAVQAVKKEAQGTSLERLTERESGIAAEIEKLEEERNAFEADRIATEARKRKADDALREALASGGGERKKIEQDLTNTEERLKGERAHFDDLVKQLRKLINSPRLAISVAIPCIERSAPLFDGLEEKKVIPNTLPEVVQDRLTRGICICGRDVSPGSEGHTALCELLEDSRHLGENQEILMHLSNVARRVIAGSQDAEHDWVADAVDADNGDCSQSQAPGRR